MTSVSALATFLEQKNSRDSILALRKGDICPWSYHRGKSLLQLVLQTQDSQVIEEWAHQILLKKTKPPLEKPSPLVIAALFPCGGRTGSHLLNTLKEMGATIQKDDIPHLLKGCRKQQAVKASPGERWRFWGVMSELLPLSPDLSTVTMSRGGVAKYAYTLAEGVITWAPENDFLRAIESSRHLYELDWRKSTSWLERLQGSSRWAVQRLQELGVDLLSVDEQNQSIVHQWLSIQLQDRPDESVWGTTSGMQALMEQVDLLAPTTLGLSAIEAANKVRWQQEQMKEFLEHIRPQLHKQHLEAGVCSQLKKTRQRL